jgi:hypothetical protein
MWNVEFSESGIRYPEYPYRPASVFPTGDVAWSRIAEADPKALPPEVRIESEILFVPATRREELIDWCARFGVRVVQRVDVWGLLLEPFLDTEFTAADAERTLRVLRENGVPDDVTDVVRRDVSESMRSYNFESGLWDAFHLGLSDVLNARMGRLTGDAHRLPDDEYDRFYWFAMELALRGRPILR